MFIGGSGGVEQPGAHVQLGHLLGVCQGIWETSSSQPPGKESFSSHVPWAMSKVVTLRKERASITQYRCQRKALLDWPFVSFKQVSVFQEFVVVFIQLRPLILT